MRCPDCNKFVSQELQDPEVNNIEINEDGNVTAEVRICAACADCGTELKEATLDLEKDFGDELKEHLGGSPSHELSIEEDGVSSIDDYKRTDRHGKPIKNSRYMTHLYGATVSFKVTCSCQAEGAEPIFCGDVEDTIEAGGMDELV